MLHLSLRTMVVLMNLLAIDQFLYQAHSVRLLVWRKYCSNLFNYIKDNELISKFQSGFQSEDSAINQQVEIDKIYIKSVELEKTPVDLLFSVTFP